MEVVDDKNLVNQVAEVGAYLRSKLEALAETHTIIGDVRGLGLFIGIELVNDRETLEPATEIARELPDKMKDEGILIGLTGQYKNILKVRPTLVFSFEQTDKLVEVLDRVLP